MIRPIKLQLLTAALLAAAVGCDSTSNNAAPHDGSVTGAGGTTGAGGAAGTTVANCGDPSLAIDPTALIDDMESPSPLTSMTPMLGGSWWAGGDDASKANHVAAITPDGSVTAELIPNGGRCGSKYASHVTGYGFGVWAVMNVSFGWGPVDGGADQLLPYDAHFRTGLTFWAMIGTTSTDQVRLNVTDQYSNDQGGICDKTVASGPTTCYDHFGVRLTRLSTTWKQYRIPFGGLAQEMFGIPRPSVDTTHLYSIDFNLPTGQIFDLWVDDLSFY